MFKFTDHVHDIWTLAKAKDVPVDIAYDMFRTDVSLGDTENTNGMIPDFDFGTAQSEWDAMTQNAQFDAYDEWRFVLRNGYSDFVRTYPSHEDMYNIVKKLREKYKMKAEEINDD